MEFKINQPRPQNQKDCGSPIVWCIFWGQFANTKKCIHHAAIKALMMIKVICDEKGVPYRHNLEGNSTRKKLRDQNQNIIYNIKEFYRYIEASSQDKSGN